VLGELKFVEGSFKN